MTEIDTLPFLFAYRGRANQMPNFVFRKCMNSKVGGNVKCRNCRTLTKPCLTAD
jgi:hypothetical protein